MQTTSSDFVWPNRSRSESLEHSVEDVEPKYTNHVRVGLKPGRFQMSIDKGAAWPLLLYKQGVFVGDSLNPTNKHGRPFDHAHALECNLSYNSCCNYDCDIKY